MSATDLFNTVEFYPSKTPKSDQPPTPDYTDTQLKMVALKNRVQKYTLSDLTAGLLCCTIIGAIIVAICNSQVLESKNQVFTMLLSEGNDVIISRIGLSILFPNYKMPETNLNDKHKEI